MQEPNLTSTHEDTKRIDLVAALISGLAVQCAAWVFPISDLDGDNPEIFTAGGLKSLLMHMGAYALAALIAFQWKGRLRARWVLIAVLGSILAAVLRTAMSFMNLDPDPESGRVPVFTVSDFPLGLAVLGLYFIGIALLTVPVMAVVHQLGLALRHDEPVTPAEDNKLVDLVAALLSGLVGQLPAWSILGEYSPGPGGFTGVMYVASSLVGMGAYALAALLVFQSNKRMRARWGWMLIAVLGPIFAVLMLDLMFDLLVSKEPDFKRLDLIWVIMTFMFMQFTVLVMAAAHYLGLALRKRRGRFT